MSHPSRRKRVGRIAAAATVAGLAVASLSGLAAATPTGATFTSSASAGGADFATRVACSAGTGYPAAVIALGPSFYYRFGEANVPYPTTVADSSGSGNTGTVVLGVPASTALTFGAASPIWCDTTAGVAAPVVDTVTTTAGFVVWNSLRTQPQVFTLMAWVRTPAGMATGGKFMGFGNSATGRSTMYDRHLYLDNAGHVVFGIWTGGPTILTSPGTVNDGKAHQVAASLGPAGGRLYVDGVLVASNAGWPAAQVYNGFWRVGWDNLGAWGTGTDPTDYGFQGTIDEAAVFEGQQLTPAQVASTYAANHW